MHRNQASSTGKKASSFAKSAPRDENKMTKKFTCPVKTFIFAKSRNTRKRTESLCKGKDKKAIRI